MSIDALDAAFIGRCDEALGLPVRREPPRAVREADAAAPDVAAAEAGDAVGGAAESTGAAAVVAWAVASAVAEAAVVDTPGMYPVAAPLPALPTGPVVDRLLVAAWPQWNELAATVEAARARGRRVIAIAGGEAGEGRSTLVAGLARVLRARGRDVVETMPEGIGGAAEPCHDKRIVIVDAGIWFPAGPIRRQRLMVASLGCEAAILVRRAARQAAPAREAVLESLGIEVLGEVLTFAPAATGAEGES